MSASPQSSLFSFVTPGGMYVQVFWFRLNSVADLSTCQRFPLSGKSELLSQRCIWFTKQDQTPVPSGANAETWKSLDFSFPSFMCRARHFVFCVPDTVCGLIESFQEITGSMAKLPHYCEISLPIKIKNNFKKRSAR